MKKSILKTSIIAGIALVVMFVGFECITARDNTTLHVYNWSDYLSPELVSLFEKENDCNVVIDTFDDNETMLAKLMAGATGYDVVFPSSYVVSVMRRNNLIQKIDMEKLPNVKKNFDTRFNGILHEDSFVYSVPYAFSMTGIAYRKDKVDETSLKNSWDDLKNPSLRKHICIMNDIREMIGIGLKRNGFSNNSINEEELAKACDYALSLKEIARRMDNVEYRIGLANGTFYAAIGYNSDILQVIQENPETAIGFYVPEEGGNSSWDEMCITSSSDHVELAHKFIDFLYEAKNAANNMEYVCSTIPNKPMMEFLDEDTKSNPLINISEELLRKLELIVDVGDNIKLYNKYWDMFTNNKKAEK